MKILGIYGSPRKKGNSETLLDRCLEGARLKGAEIETLRPCKMAIAGCIGCGGCDKTGKCVVDDDMQKIYPLLLEADAIVLAAPIYFYSVPAQVKALIDRCQALWCKRFLEKSPENLRSYDSGTGYLIAVGATRGANLFEGTNLVTRYWYDALDMSFEGGLYVKAVDKRGEISDHPETIEDAFALGGRVVGEYGRHVGS